MAHAQMQFQFDEDEEDYPLDQYYDVERISYLDALMPDCDRKSKEAGQPETDQHDYNTMRDLYCTRENPHLPLPTLHTPNREHDEMAANWITKAVLSHRNQLSLF